MERASLTRFAWVSIAAAVVTIILKATAYYITGSVGLLSDALESIVNLVAALMALAMLTVAARPPDEMHAYGHSKARIFFQRARRIAHSAGCCEHCLDGRSTPDCAPATGAGRYRPRRIGSRGYP